MSSAQSHEQLQEMLPAAALDILEGPELEPVLAHTRDCAECARLLQEYRDGAATLALGLPARQMDPLRSVRLRSRLMARVRADGQQRGSRGGARVGQWAGWLIAASLAGVLLIHHSVHRTVDYGWLTAGGLTLLLVGVAAFAMVQRNRSRVLRDRLADLERRKPNS